MHTIVKLDWIHVDSESLLGEIPQTNFYCFVRSKSPVYIGISHKQHVNREVKQTIRAFDIDTRGLKILTGLLTIKSGGERVTRALVRDVEQLLVYTHKPSYNTHYVNRLDMSRDVIIHNVGTDHLHPRVKFTSDTPFVGKKKPTGVIWVPFV